MECCFEGRRATSRVCACSWALGLESELAYRRSSRQGPRFERKVSSSGIAQSARTPSSEFSCQGLTQRSSLSTDTCVLLKMQQGKQSSLSRLGTGRPSPASCLLPAGAGVQGHWTLKPLWLSPDMLHLLVTQRSPRLPRCPLPSAALLTLVCCNGHTDTAFAAMELTLTQHSFCSRQRTTNGRKSLSKEQVLPSQTSSLQLCSVLQWLIPIQFVKGLLDV